MRYFKTVAIMLVLCLTPISYGSITTSGLGGSDGSVVMAFGKADGEKHTEFGVTLMMTNENNNGNNDTFSNYETAIGPYAAMKFDVPGLDKYISGDEVETFAGAAILYNFDQKRPVYTPFVGIAFMPHRQISPLAVFRYNIMGENTNGTNFEAGGVGFFGIRVLIK